MKFCCVCGLLRRTDFNASGYASGPSSLIAKKTNCQLFFLFSCPENLLDWLFSKTDVLKNNRQASDGFQVCGLPPFVKSLILQFRYAFNMSNGLHMKIGGAKNSAYENFHMRKDFHMRKQENGYRPTRTPGLLISSSTVGPPGRSVTFGRPSAPVGKKSCGYYIDKSKNTGFFDFLLNLQGFQRFCLY